MFLPMVDLLGPVAVALAEDWSEENDNIDNGLGQSAYMYMHIF